MKQNNMLAAFVMIIMLWNCSSEPFDIKGTEWVYRYSPDVADSLIFKDTLYVRYGGELGLHSYGEYYTQNDTIYFERKGEIWMYDPPRYVPTEEGKDTKGRAIINKENKLQFLSPLRFENNQWIDTRITFGEYSIFEKVE
jgi:hypothetical protein